jgi:hypothetical protein
MDTAWTSSGAVSVSSAERVYHLLEAQRISLSEKYLTSFATHGERYSLTLQDYIAHEGWAREKRLVCPEHYEFNLASVEGVSENLGVTDAPFERISVHAAYGGSVTPLHFDWDMSRVHHLCVFGRRRIWLARPTAARPLPAAGNSILADFEGMESEQREGAFHLMGATNYDLAVGEFVRFPSFWWHLVEYSEASIAVSVRSELDALLRPITVLPRSAELQYVLEGLAGADKPDKIKVITRLVQAFIASLTDGNMIFSTYSAAIQQSERELGLPPMRPDPWIIAKSPAQPMDPGSLLRSVREKISSRAAEVDLCQRWLFAGWPKSAPITDDDASMLAGLMACAMSRPK